MFKPSSGSIRHFYRAAWP